MQTKMSQMVADRQARAGTNCM